MRQLALFFGLALAAGSACASETAYVGVIDAGSSASRLHVYAKGLDGQTLDDVLEISGAAGALASFSDSPASAGDKALGALLGQLDRELSQRGVAKTDIELHVLATGGMRMLPAAAAQAIETSVRRTLADGGYRTGRVETISGEMEGFYAWLDVNAALGALAPGKSPVGVVEVGGASMQVAYAGAPAAAPGVVTASYRGVAYSVRSISLLGLGIEEARKRMAQGADAGACYPEGLVSAVPGPRQQRSAFDTERCATAFAGVMGAAASVPRAEVAALPFVGLGRPLTGVLADWGLPPEKPSAMKDAARGKCLLPWAEFVRTYGDTPYTPYLCANSVYLATLLFDARGVGFRPEQVVVADKIAGRRPSWTRGAALMLREAK